MKVLVTGASGMLGATLCRQLLKNGYQVRALTRRPMTHPLLEGLEIEESRGDLLDEGSLKKACRDCQGVFHLAGKVSYNDRDRKLLSDVNVSGTRNVLQAAAQAAVRRIVVTSSTAAVGLCQPGQSPLDESAPFLPRYERVPYMATKHRAECEALQFRDAEVVVLNPATIYGAGDVYQNTGELLRKTKLKKVRFFPPGGTAVVSVNDCARGHQLAFEKGKPGQRYILATANHTYREIFHTVADFMNVDRARLALPSSARIPALALANVLDFLTGWTGRMPTLRHVAEIGFANRYFDSGKARQHLGWAPVEDLSTMIGQAIDFYQRHKDSLAAI